MRGYVRDRTEHACSEVHDLPEGHRESEGRYAVRTPGSTFIMSIEHFNHRAAIAAAQDKASELHTRAMRLMFAHFIAIVNRSRVAMAQQRLEIRRRGLEQFIDDPYRADSLPRIGFEKDRRSVLEAGMPQ